MHMRSFQVTPYTGSQLCSMVPFRSWPTVVACIVLFGALAAQACTSGAYQDPKDPKSFVSWRFLDLPVTYFNNIAFVPAGKPMSLLPVVGRNYSSWGKELTVKNSFICQTSTLDLVRILVAAAEPGLMMDPEKWPGTCSEGFNVKGLHVSALMQRDSTGVPRYSGSGPAFEQMEIVQVLLAKYDSVDAIWADLESGLIKPVLNPRFEIISKLTFKSEFFMLHYNIHDNTGKSMVIQYSGPDNLQWFDSTKYQGALANNPLWESQTAYYNNWWATQNDPYVTMHDSLFVNLPGSYNSSHRFARAAKLPTVGYSWEWPKNIETSPLYAVNGQPSTNPTLMAVMDVFNAIYLPMGMDDAGGEQRPGGKKQRDITWFVYIADHKLNHYYYRVANTPQWKRIDMNAVDWRNMDSIRYMKMRPGKWWVDESNGYARTTRDLKRSQSAGQMTLDALKADIAALVNNKA